MPKGNSPSTGAKSIWSQIREGATKNIGLTVGGALGTAAIAGAVAAWTAMKTWIVVDFPPGLIIASTIECRDIRGGGWSNFDAAGGRFIIGAGPHPGNPGVTKSYTAFTTEGALPSTGYEKSTGGEEKHILTIPEMPVHDHANSPHVFLLQSDSNDTIGSVRDQTTGEPNLHTTGRIKPEGGNQPHNIIPPYVALYYCKRM